MRAVARGPVTLHEFDLLASRGALVAGCSGRGGGVSAAPYDALNVALHVGDEPAAVLENRRRLAAALGVEPSWFVFAEQVHGDGVQVVTTADRGRGATDAHDAIPGADALVTGDADVVLGVMAADCVPVVLHDPVTPAIGVVHAGWRGTVRHVTRSAVETMRRELGSDPADVLAGVGPSIGPSSYAVGADVAERVAAAFPGRGVVRAHDDGGSLVDLWAANVADLLDAGVRRAHVELAGIDTFASADRFFSHRRQAPTGRFLALAMLRAA